MDAPTLDDALAGISVSPPDDLEASPQFAQIRAARTFFRLTVIPGMRFRFRRRIPDGNSCLS